MNPHLRIFYRNGYDKLIQLRCIRNPNYWAYAHSQAVAVSAAGQELMCDKNRIIIKLQKTECTLREFLEHGGSMEDLGCKETKTKGEQ